MSDQKESNYLRPREKITIDTQIPPLPSRSERLSPPDEDFYEHELRALESALSVLKERKKVLANQISDRKESRSFGDQLRQSNTMPCDKFMTRQEKIVYKRKLSEEFDCLKREFHSMIDMQKKVRVKIKVFDRAKAESQMAQIQNRIESTTLTLQEEKKLVAELSELQISLPLIAQFASRNKKIDENKARQEALKSQIASISEDIEMTLVKLTESKSYEESLKQKRTSEIKSLINEREQVNSEIRSLESNFKKVQNEFRDKKNAYFKQLKEIKQIEWMMKIKNNLISQEEKRQKKQFFKKMEEINKPHPYANEIISCDTFIAYLNKFIPKEELKIANEKMKAEYVPRITEQMAKEVEDFFGKSEKKVKKANIKKNKKTEGLFSNQPVDLLNFFSYTGIKIPSSIEEARQAVEELKKRKADWLSQSPNTNSPRPANPSNSNNRSPDLTLNPINFPVPEESKYTEKYEIFIGYRPVLEIKELDIRGKRGNSQYNK